MVVHGNGVSGGQTCLERETDSAFHLVSVHSVAVAPAPKLVFVADLDGKSSDVNTDCRVGECAQAGVGDVGVSSALEADERAGEPVYEAVFHVSEHWYKIKRFVFSVPLCCETGSTTDIEAVAETVSMR